MIPSFEIENFRLFKHLVIDKLSRVNLITGKNNVGKTSLLEALKIYLTEGSIKRISEVLRGRDENAILQESDVKHFFRYKKFDKQELKIYLGLLSNEKNSLEINFVWFVEDWDKNGNRKPRILNKKESIDFGAQPGLQVLFKGNSQLFDLEKENHIIIHPITLGKKYPVCFFVPSNVINIVSFIDLWEKIDLTDKADVVIDCLHLIAPELERISTKGKGKSRIFFAKTSDYSFPVPLYILGEGINKLLYIILCLVNASNGTLLIDEIENGIHYSIQPKLWKLIMELAERLDVQVFVTTHSWDSVEGFQEALNEFHYPEQGQLIRLKEKNGEILTTVFDAKEIAIATRYNIEVR